jgi:hypothetical protein
MDPVLDGEGFGDVPINIPFFEKGRNLCGCCLTEQLGRGNISYLVIIGGIIP